MIMTTPFFKNLRHLAKLSIFTAFAFLLTLGTVPDNALAANKRLALFPLAIYSGKPLDYLQQGVKSMLSSRLSGGGLDIIGEKEVLSVTGDEVIDSKDKAIEACKRLNADYAVFGSITAAGTGYSLDLAVLDLTKEGAPVERLSQAGDENSFIPKLADVAYQVRAVIEGRPLPAPTAYAARAPQGADIPQNAKGLFSPFRSEASGATTTEKGLFYQAYQEYQGFKPTGSIPVSISPLAFDAADLDGDGKDELLVCSRKKLLVYSSNGMTYVMKDSLSSSVGEDFLKVSAGDTNGSGRAEIFIVARYGLRAKTTAYEWRGKFKKLADKAGHLRAIKSGKSGSALLIYQNSKVDHFFTGPFFEMEFDATGGISKAKELPELKRAIFYTLNRADLDKDGVYEWIGLGKGSRLYVWDAEGNVLWKGGIKMGGTNNAIRLGQPEGPGDAQPRIAFDSGVVITDIDGDEKADVLAVDNIPLSEVLGGMVFHSKSTLTAFKSEGTNMTPAWKTRELPYCITDIQARGKTIFLAATNPKFDNIGEGSGRILWFE